MAILGFIVGGAVFFIWGITKQRNDAVNLEAARAQAEEITKGAQTRSQLVVKEAELKAKDMVVGAKADAEREMRDRRREIAAVEQKLERREETFEKRQEAFERREADLNRRDQSLRTREKSLTDKEELLQGHIDEARTKLEAVAGLTREEAKRSLMDEMIGSARTDAAKHIRIVEEEAREEADRRAKRVVAIAIERLAGEFVAERTVSVVALPNDEMKGRIIGREGRNIRAIEAATGMDLIIDDTPEAVIISGFDPVRREIARASLETLIQDGRIHPARIEEVVDKCKSNLFKSIKEDGDKAMFDLGVHGVNAEIVRLIGSLKYRTSYTQNNYSHSIEVGFLAGIMAGELGVNVKAARRAGVLHDLGKALDHSIEGSHAVIGADFAKKYGETQDIVHAIRAHHEDEKPNTILAQIVQAADALSGARPGARREMMESYVTRLEDLETIGNSFDGVIRTFAIQAGREIRVMVESEKVTDEQSIMLSRDIARKIEREMTYPGQIKVTVVRETRAVEHAR